MKTKRFFQRLTAAAMLCSAAGAANAALELSLSANPSPAEPGETINLSLTVSNTDSFERSGVQIQMEYPLGLNNLREAAISGPGDCINTVSSGNLCEATETLVWSLGPIAAGRSRTVDLPPQVAASVTPGTEIIFNAEATDNSSDVASASDSVLVVGDRQLELSIQPVNQHPVSPGTEAIYQLNWGYSATSSAANNVNLSLPIPQGLSFVSADNGGTLVGNEVQWPLGTLVPGQVGEARVVLQTAGNLPLGRSITTEASLQAGSGPATRAGVISRLEADTGLRLAIEANANPAETGERIQLALTISNASPFDRSDVVVAMRFPVGFANLAENRITNAGNCINSVSNGNVCEVTERLIWNFDQIPAGRGITLTLPPALTALPGEWVMMDAYAVDSTGAETGASEAVAVVNDRTLELALSELTQDPAQPGGSVSYQLSWGHSATSAVAANTVLSLPVPEGLSFSTADSGGSLVGNQVQWNLGTLVPGQTGEQRVSFVADGSIQPGSLIKSEAMLESSNGQLTRGDEVTRMETDTGLQLAIAADNTPATPGERIDLALTVTNHSFFDRSDVVLQMRHPVGLNNLSEATMSDGGFCLNTVNAGNSCEATELFTWNLDTITAGRGVTVRLPPVVNAAVAAGDIIELNAQVVDSSGEITLAHEALAVNGSRDLELELTEDGTDPVTPGDDITYVANWGYSGSSSAASGVVLKLPVPEGLSFVSATGGGTQVGDEVQWPLGTVQPGHVGELSATFAVPAAIGYGTLIKAEASLSNSSGAMTLADETSRIEPEAPLTVLVQASPGSALPGEPLTVSATVTNNSSFERQDVVLRMYYPTGLNDLAEDTIGDNADCDNIGRAGNSCEATETITWPLGALAAGGSVTVSLPPVIASSVVEGSQIPFIAWVEDSTARSSATDVVGIGEGMATVDDIDEDGVGDNEDNCLGFANPNQEDTDGDGFGNRCDPDLNNDGIVDFLDFNLLRSAFFSSGSGLDEDFNQDGFVNFGDLAILRAFYGEAPGPSAVAN
ncbi:MAG: hypothetical protein CML06_04030 [Pseudomonadales bacterium]|nr:hypothetical protein [Pseudomonadales bacterium]